MQNTPFRHPVLITCATIVLAVTACQKDEAAEAPAKSTKTKNERFVIEPVAVEVRGDNLAYLPGTAQPFTGDAVELHQGREPAPLAKRTPYRNGVRHGIETSYSPGGKLKEERKFETGTPISSTVYHGNGQKKIEATLNKLNRAEGPQKRWYENGVLHAEYVFDSEERGHGEEKVYDKEGKLAGHYRKNHGVLVEVIFETEEEKAERTGKVYPPKP